MSTKKDRTFLNVVSTVSLQVVTLLSGFVIPRLILDSFGSEINGLVVSLTQFLNYISLIEGGVGAVILANLYKPLATGDKAKISAVVVTANRFFQKLALLFLVYQFVLAAVYPFFVKTELSWTYISTLTIILGLSTFIQYYFSLTWRLLLQADKRMYFSAFVQGVAVVLNLAVTIVLLRVYPSVHVVKIGAGLVFFSQPLILNRYILRHYSIDRSAQQDPTLLAQRWDGFGINVASMVHGSTATVILTLITGLSSVSVFNVYLLVANGLKALITSISSGLVPTIGNYYAKGELEDAKRLFDMYDLLMFFVSFLCFTVAAVTVAPFALLYAENATDAEYYRPFLGAVLMAGECFFCIRDPYVNMAYSAGHFRQVSKYAYAEAAGNILLSVPFTLLLGMDGVVIGLLVSVLYRTIAQVYYLKNNILHRPARSFWIKIVAFGLVSAGSAAASVFWFRLGSLSVASWMIYAVKVTALEFALLLAVSLLLCRKECRTFLSFVNIRRGT